MPDYFTLVRYDGYYGEPAGIKNINCINYNNSADAMATAIMNGDLDFVNRTAVADAMIADSIVAMNPNAVVMGNAGHGQRCWFFNLGNCADGNMKADLQKKEVRQAFDILMDEESYINASKSQLAPALESMGMENVTVETAKLLFAGEERYGLRIHGTIQGVDFDEALVCIKNGNYIASVTVGTVGENKTDDLLAMFKRMEM
jgi:ABC-type transport system substrate-binding protein